MENDRRNNLDSVKFNIFLKKTVENKIFNFFTGFACLISILLDLYPLQEINSIQYQLPISLLYCRVVVSLLILFILTIFVLDLEFNSKSIRYYLNSKGVILALIGSIAGVFLSISILAVTKMQLSRSLRMVLTLLCSMSEIVVVIFLIQLLFSNMNRKNSQADITLLKQSSTDIMIPANF